MDELDLRILQGMGVEPWGGRFPDPEALRAAYLARRLDVTPETVRDRIQAMEATGVIAGYQVYPNLRHLGLDLGTYRIQVRDEPVEDDALEQALLVDGVLEVVEFVGPDVVVALAHASDGERRRRLQVLAKLLKAVREPDLVFDHAFPPVDRAPTPLDWRILQALRGRARRPLAEVADEVGVSYRTVRRHLNRLLEERSAFIVPLVEMPRLEGAVPFDLAVGLEEGADLGVVTAVTSAFRDRQLHRAVPASPDHLFLVLRYHAPNLQEMEAMRGEVAAIPGVRAARTFLTVRSLESTWLDEILDRVVGGETSIPTAGEPGS